MWKKLNNRGGYLIPLNVREGVAPTITTATHRVGYTNIISLSNFPMSAVKIIEYEKVSEWRSKDAHAT